MKSFNPKCEFSKELKTESTADLIEQSIKHGDPILDIIFTCVDFIHAK